MAVAEEIFKFFFITILEAASSGDGKKNRRNSDSAVHFRPKEELPLLKLKHAETELKFKEERTAVIEREIAAKLSPEILADACSPEEKATFLKQLERWKGERLYLKCTKVRYQPRQYSRI